ncbi:MAG: hypothetical protein WC150_06795 [Bacteroidia bacterium]
MSKYSSSSEAVFNTLDSYANESHNLYVVVKSLLSLPSCYDEYDFPNPNGMIHALAFAKLCEEYLYETIRINVQEDIMSVVEELKLKEIYEELDEEFTDEELQEHIQIKLSEARATICKGIAQVFPSEELQLKLFASIFDENEDRDYQGALNFVKNNLNQKL